MPTATKPATDGLERLRQVANALQERWPPPKIERQLTGSERLTAYVAELQAKYPPQARPELTLIQGGDENAS